MSPEDAARSSGDIAAAPLSIALVTGSASRLAGGLFNSVRRSALALSAAGHRVTVLALDDAHAAEDAAAWAPLVPLVAPRRGPAALGYAPAIGAALREGRFDVVHQHGIWQAFSRDVAAWRRRTGGPVMISPRGMLDPWALANAAWKKRITAALYERDNLAGAACLHALAASEAASMRAFGLKGPVAVIANGTDIPQPAEVGPPDWWPAEGRVLLFVSRIHPKKGLAELVEAWARLVREAPRVADGWRLVLAGWDDGGHAPALRQAIARHGLEGRILMPGPLYGAAKDAALRHADAFVLPSHSEGLPMSILEAWAYGLPVAMTAACNLPEGFEAGAAEPVTTDPAELAAALAAFLGADPARRAAMGEAGRTLARTRFGWAEIARRHAEVYRWMVAGCPAATRPADVETG